MDLLLAKGDLSVASRYREWLRDQASGDRIVGRIEAQSEATVSSLFRITKTRACLASNPSLARSIRNRFAYLDPLNHLQIELLKRHRAGDTSESVKRGIHLSINGLAAGLRNSG